MIIRRILLKLSRRRRLEEEMKAELAFHRDMARKHANPIGLGHMSGIEESARDLWRFTLIEDFWRDVIYAVRSLGRTPGFAVIAILTLALGIGANTAMFTLLHRVMLASLPVHQPEQLIEILGTRGGGPPGVSFSYPALQDLRRGSKTSNVLGFSAITFPARIDSAIERLSGQFVTGDYFSGLGVSGVRGRPITPEDDRTATPNPVAVISYAMWQNRFGGHPGTIGKTVVLVNVTYTIVGIAPADFYGVEVGRQTDIWVPLESERLIRRPSRAESTASKWLQMIARLKPGATIEQATAELRVLYTKSIVENDIPEMMSAPRVDPAALDRLKTWSLVTEPAGSGLSRTRQQYSTPLKVLMSIVGVLLLIASTNVAHLLFARALTREKEIALRLSLGAGRSRLIRQLLTESTVLVIAGGTLGVFIAHLLTRYLTAFLAGSNALVLNVAPNLVTLGFTAAVAVVAVVVFGLMPAFRSTDMNFATELKGTAQGWGTSKGHRWSSGLIVAQVSLLLVLILGAGLFVRTLHNLNSIDLGFNRSNVLLAVVDPWFSGHSLETLKVLTEQLIDRVEALPGVRSVSMTRFSPISGGSGTNLDFRIDRVGAVPVIARNVWVQSIGSNYFETMGIPVSIGREFGRQDQNSTAPVAIVNQAFAQRYFGNASPVGKGIYLRGPKEIRFEVIGVVGNSKNAEIRETVDPTVYRPVFQQFADPMQLVIRTERDPTAMAAAVRAEAKSLIGTVSVRERTLEDHIDATLVRERLVTRLAVFFGGLALVLAVIGLYGVVSNRVARRTKEIGIRIALGFNARGAISMVLREIFVLVGAGIILGLPLAVLMARTVDKLLYGLSPDDPITIVVSVCALMLAALAAGFIPARRAARVDPMIALRNE